MNAKIFTVTILGVTGHSGSPGAERRHLHAQATPLENFCAQRFTSKTSLASFDTIVHPHSFQQRFWHHPGLPGILCSPTLLLFPSCEEFPDNSNFQRGGGHQEGNTSQVGLPGLVPRTHFWKESHCSEHS